MAGALIVTAELGAEDFARLDRLRRDHYPPERNQLPAHLTLFHALPPSAEPELRRQLASHSAAPAPRAMLGPPFSLGNGVAYRILSDGLDDLWTALAEHFRGLLSAQDAQGWRAHVTVQNKVSSKEARALLARLEREHVAAPLRIAALGLHRYLGGPWEALGRYPFRGVS